MRTINGIGSIARRQPRRLSPEELFTIDLRCDLHLTYCFSDRDKAEGDAIWSLILVALETGLTLRELFMLQWRQIDFRARSVHAIDYAAVTARDVPFGEVAIYLVRTRSVYIENYPSSVFVFPFWSGNISPISIRRAECRLNRMLDSVFENLDITFDDVVFSSQKGELG